MRKEGQRLDEREKLAGYNNFAPDCFLSLSLWISLSMYSQLMKNKFVLRGKKSKTHETKGKKDSISLDFYAFLKDIKLRWLSLFQFSDFYRGSRKIFLWLSLIKVRTSCIFEPYRTQMWCLTFFSLLLRLFSTTTAYMLITVSNRILRLRNGSLCLRCIIGIRYRK